MSDLRGPKSAPKALQSVAATGVPLLARSDPRRAQGAPEFLRSWNDTAVLHAADVHVATRLASLVGGDSPEVVLAAALAVRAVRLGHVCVDLSTVASTATSEIDPGVDLSWLPWPDPRAWLEILAASPLVAVGDDQPDPRPLRLVAERLYLDRYWRQECQVAADLIARASRPVSDLDEHAVRAVLDRLFPPQAEELEAGGGRAASDLQRLAAAAAMAGRLTVVAGGPGTGKTTTVARILAALFASSSAEGRQPPRVALAAPTGKAAARLVESLHAEAENLDVDAGTRRSLMALEASTLHRLLGWRPDSASRFRHDRTNRLPHDAVVVDETSMLSLPLMAKLVDAVRPDARLVLVGDPQQLASVEAGAVLGDLVGPTSQRMVMTEPARQRLGALAGMEVPAARCASTWSVGDGIVVLEHVHRFGGGIAELAAAIVEGDAEGAVRLLDGRRSDLRLIPNEDASVLRQDVVRAGAVVVEAAGSGRADDAVAALGSLRVLCAHRQGPAGVELWTERIERWLATSIPGYGSGGIWYLGRPLLVTANDYELRLFNGDTGVVVAGEHGRPVAVFERSGGLKRLAPARLGSVQTLHAMTVHKSQGSQFDEVVVVLPDTDGAIVTRELLYTAVTRARRQVTLVGSEAVVKAAVRRPISRASGLRDRLWGPLGEEIRDSG